MRINITPLPDGERERLILKLRSGDAEAIEPIITSYVPLAHKIAKRYHDRHPYLIEEITASAMFGLAYAVTRVQEGNLKEGVDIAGYLTMFIRSEVRDCILSDFPIALTRYALENGEETPTFVPLEEAKTVPFRDWRERRDTIDDLIKDIGYEPREVQVIQGRLMRKSMDDIAEELQVSRRTVFYILEDIQEKWRHFNA